ncbi:hypothetical protein QIH01_26555 [Brevibacillus brevis]|nr:hypothetical protein QIH01_26555 [Brevibacillus brevis]
MRYRKLFHPQKKSPNGYEVAVDNVFQNLTDHQIKAGDTIKLYRVVGFRPDKDKEIAPMADHKQTEIPEGEYLLFLNGDYDEEVGHVRWFTNTPNQLFKATGGDSGPSIRTCLYQTRFPLLRKRMYWMQSKKRLLECI